MPMRILFPHIPKCAGTSLRNHLAQRDDFFEDYFNHPTWDYEPDKVAGQEKQNELKLLVKNRQSWIIFGHFAPFLYYELDYSHQIILIRNPLERAVSHYYYIKQLLPDNKITRRRHKEVGLIKESCMSLEEFVTLNHIKYFYSKFYLKNITIDDRLFVFSMINFEDSINQINQLTGLGLDQFSWLNKNIYNRQFAHLRSNFQEDFDLYDYLLSRDIKR